MRLSMAATLPSGSCLARSRINFSTCSSVHLCGRALPPSTSCDRRLANESRVQWEPHPNEDLLENRAQNALRGRAPEGAPCPRRVRRSWVSWVIVEILQLHLKLRHDAQSLVPTSFQRGGGGVPKSTRAEGGGEASSTWRRWRCRQLLVARWPSRGPRAEGGGGGRGGGHSPSSHGPWRHDSGIGLPYCRRRVRHMEFATTMAAPQQPSE